MNRSALLVAARISTTLTSVVLAPALVSCGTNEQADPKGLSEVERKVAVVKERHDFNSETFTQGLEVAEDGTLYVGAGQVGQSRIYRSTPQGEELISAEMDPEFFGEGITRVGPFLWQLSWQDEVAIKRDSDTLEEVGRTTYAGQGWGICGRQDEVIFSDGTSELRRMDSFTLAERERFTVTLDGEPVDYLNELECVDDQIYANIFMSTDIVRIDAATGVVTAVIDASGLPNNATGDPNNVLNGIAHIPGTDEFYLSGKRWPDLYRVTFDTLPR